MTAIDEEMRHAWMCVSGWARHHQRLSSRNFFFCCRQQKLLLVKMIGQTTTTGVWFIFHLTSSSSFSLLRRMDVFFLFRRLKKATTTQSNLQNKNTKSTVYITKTCCTCERELLILGRKWERIVRIWSALPNHGCFRFAFSNLKTIKLA